MEKLAKRIKRRTELLIKNVYQKFIATRDKHKDILFIVGCQRSGTTMILNIFDKDYAVKIYREESDLSSDDPTGRRFKPLDQVDQIIKSNKVSAIVAKPLVETQNIDRLLAYFPDAKALWVYRDYKAVALSNLKSFGTRNGLQNIQPIYQEDTDNWRAERVSKETSDIIRKYYHENISEQDAAALFWYSRNVLYFERQLDSNKRVQLCKYEEFVKSPEDTMKQIYSFMGASYPRRNLTAMVHAGSVRKGKDVLLSPEIEQLCKGLMERLDTAFGTAGNL